MILFLLFQVTWKGLKNEKMTDLIEKTDNLLIQHGKENNRVYLMKFNENASLDVIQHLNTLAKENEYTKIIAKVPESAKDFFIDNGYISEAYIKNFYHGKKDTFFLSKFLSKDRSNFKHKNEIFNTIQFALEKCQKNAPAELEKAFSIKKLTQSNTPQMIPIYKKVFKSYPFPIFDEKYLLKTMNSNVDYFGVFFNGKIIALSSSEMDLDSQNTEMTDFATLPEFRGKGLALNLLKVMEKEAVKKGIKTSYTIARSASLSMNIIFSKMGYEFGGTLVNNSNICGKIEMMNVWFKNLK